MFKSFQDLKQIKEEIREIQSVSHVATQFRSKTIDLTKASEFIDKFDLDFMKGYASQYQLKDKSKDYT